MLPALFPEAQYAHDGKVREGKHLGQWVFAVLVRQVIGTPGRIAFGQDLSLLSHLEEQSKTVAHHGGHHKPLYRMRGLVMGSVSLLRF